MGPIRSEKGNVTLLMVLMLPIVMLLLALGVDVSHAHSLGVMQKQSLDDALEEVQMRQEEVKFSERPDRTVRDLVASALERDGYIGRVRVHYLERTVLRTPGSSKDDERHIVVEVAGGRGAGSLFGPGGLWPVTNSAVLTMRAYASYQVYRPPCVSAVDHAVFAHWYELLINGREGEQSVAQFVADGPLGLEDLSVKARTELDRLEEGS